MFVIDQLIFLGAVLLLVGIISSKLSARIGLPVLVLFLMVGMLAGEGGIGGIAFENAEAAHALGTLALAMILFDGGLQTPLKAIKLVWKPSALLATVGVLITAVITGLAAMVILDLPILEGLLIGAIVGSTDAAAVFSLLRNAGIHIKARVKATLEIESASNDPMAIFLTIGLLEVLVNDMELGGGMLKLFASQMVVGGVVGLGIGWVSVQLINRIHLIASGLYPVMVTACGLLSFGLAATLGGSGFLAIFLAGIVLGNSRFVFQRGTFLFHDGLAWLSQITMFVVLGLLINPKGLLDVWLEGLIISAVLILIARPLAVMPFLALFRYGKREMAFVSWVGLRGSVPIILAIFPLIYGLPGAELIFTVVFFVVLLSATIQGSTLPLAARLLGLAETPPANPAATLEITTLQDVDADIVQYVLDKKSRAVGRRLSELALPDSVVVAMITRDNAVIPPRGSTRLCEHDHLFVVLKPEVRPFVDCVFSESPEKADNELPEAELKVKGTTKAEDIYLSYGVALGTSYHGTLNEVLHRKLAEKPSVDTSLTLNGIRLRVCEMVDDRILTVGLLTAEEPSSEATADA